MSVIFPWKKKTEFDMNSIDLFTGLGGFTLALHDFVRPLMYCDKDVNIKSLILRHIDKHTLPNVQRWEDDIKCVTAKTFPYKPDIIMGGFPCVGFSPAGHRQGFEDPQSSLFYELKRVVCEFRPPLVFMENVPLVMREFQTIHQSFNEMDYDLAWCILPATIVGSPQRRKRWFCLARRRNATIDLPRVLLGDINKWKEGSAGCPMTTPDISHLRRLPMLGNALVPSVARFAFFLLARSLHDTDPMNPSEVLHFKPVRDDGVMITDDATQIAGTSFGFTQGRDVYRLPDTLSFLAKKIRPPLNIKLRSSNYSPKEGVIPRYTLDLRSEITKKYWATPRYSGVWGSNFLTDRVARDLATQCCFCDEPVGTPKHRYTNANFVEWLMGFPKDWTK